jgi:hypothetical protein
MHACRKDTLLLALTRHMLLQGIDFLCVFDASARPCLEEFQGTYFADLHTRLIRFYPQHFTEVPVRTVADEAILDISTMIGPKIITNDLFRDHVARYPWLESDGNRRLSPVRLQHGGRPHREVLLWREAKIPVPPPRKLRVFVEEYTKLLASFEQDHPPAHS